MKILLVSDEESESIWEYFEPERFKDVELIISCGDLKAEYLSFLVTMIPAPLYYIHGNHDARFYIKPPEGCISAEDRIIEYKGLRILGFGGCFGLRGAGHVEYTEKQMERRIKRHRLDIHRKGGVDILVTHAPALGLGDLDTKNHKGYQAFLDFIDKYKPRYHFHGHVHLRYGGKAVPIIHGDTTIINACGYRIIETAERNEKDKVR